MKKNVMFLLATLLIVGCQKSEINSEENRMDCLETYQVPLLFETKAIDSELYMTIVYDTINDAVVSASLSDDALDYFGITEEYFKSVLENTLFAQETKDYSSDVRREYLEKIKECKEKYEKGKERTRCIATRTVEYLVACLDAVVV